ncbi:lamin tail domain-containing protein 1-like isoform X2 [Alosa alosa]|uniref:lamin tail domain-containing protein 1-like isoform X2 n=1 Tax=Alosa alosa TaxID=278164 RepID=UPI0020154D0B|nr:lamin tail domain-containing protein 1-like isoform X2 [Alosa alosa]
MSDGMPEKPAEACRNSFKDMASPPTFSVGSMRRPLTTVDTHARRHPRRLALAQRPVTALSLSRSTCSMDIWDIFYNRFNEKGPPAKTEKARRPATAKQHVWEYSSTTGHMKIMEVQAQGHFVRLGNCSQTEQDIGGYYLQQSIKGQPVNCFLFPPRTFIQPGASITVWSEHCRPCAHSFNDHVWTGLSQIGSSPEYTTILCTTNGQAVAWYRPARCSMLRTCQAWEEPERKPQSRAGHSLSRGDSKRATPQDIAKQEPHLKHSDPPPFLRLRRKTDAKRVSQSPWAQSPSSITHPCCISVWPQAHTKTNIPMQEPRRSQKKVNLPRHAEKG